MKSLIYDSKFKKSFQKLIKVGNLSSRIKARMDLFLEDRANPILRDHQLTGKFVNFRAFSVTGDVRIIYKEYSDHIRLIDIGTHNQVYGG